MFSRVCAVIRRGRPVGGHAVYEPPSSLMSHHFCLGARELCLGWHCIHLVVDFAAVSGFRKILLRSLSLCSSSNFAFPP
jgi:hypothetical protein